MSFPISLAASLFLVGLAASVLPRAVAQDRPSPYPPPFQHVIHPLPHAYLAASALPRNFTCCEKKDLSIIEVSKQSVAGQTGAAHSLLTFLD